MFFHKICINKYIKLPSDNKEDNNKLKTTERLTQVFTD